MKKRLLVGFVAGVVFGRWWKIVVSYRLEDHDAE